MSAETLHIATLGGLSIRRGTEELTGRLPLKAQLLLCYLAVTRRTHPRHALAGLLWGEKPEERAMTSLRQALSALRRYVAPYLRISRYAVAFDPTAPYTLDTELFERAQLDPGGGEGVAALEQAIALYQGDFLEGVHVRDAPLFEEWLTIQREQLRMRALDMLHALVAHYRHRGDYPTALRYARRILDLDPWCEDAHRQVMWLLAHTGQLSAALTQYETCRRVLVRELGVEPMAETQALYRRIRAARQYRPPPLPPQPTPFVGRDEELRSLAHQLLDPDCRLLVLTGPGGIGKTRLALQLAERLQAAFLHGVAFVPLIAITSPLYLPHAIANALRIPIRNETSLLDHLRTREMLLVLDNFEHLEDGGPFLAELLQAAPDVKLLVTSQARLRLRWAWHVEVEGLAVPDEDAPSPEQFDGVRLFVQEARRVRATFDLTRHAAAVVRICRLVEGLPLGIEIAAALMADHQPDEVADGIARTLAILRSPMQDAPRRHRSLQATFDHSWALLNADERRAFRRLAVFRGGFELEAAGKITSVPPSLLKALETKSLLRRGPEDRYEMLEVLRLYAEERLLEVGDEWARTHARHCEYYAALLRRAWKHIRGGMETTRIFQSIEREIENIQAAWLWAVTQGDWRTLSDMLLPLSNFYGQRSWFQEWEQAASEAVAVLRRVVERGVDEARAALGRSLTRLGIALHSLGRHEEARALLVESLRLTEEAGDRWEQALALDNLAVLSSLRGDYQQGNALFEQSLALFAAVGDRRMEAILLNNIGLTHRIMGEHDKAYHFTLESLRICREEGFRVEEARAVLALGLTAHSQEKYDEAVRRYREGLALFRTLGDRWGEAMTLGNLGAALTEKGDYDSARNVLTESLALRREMGDRLGIVIALNNLARVARELGEEVEASSYLHEALTLAVEIPSAPQALDALVEVARLWAQRGETARALELAYLAAHHPATDIVTRRSVEEIIPQLERQLPPAVTAEARAWGAKREVLAVAGEVASRLVGTS